MTGNGLAAVDRVFDLLKRKDSAIAQADRSQVAGLDTERLDVGAVTFAVRAVA